jgi:hypothetical protein
LIIGGGPDWYGKWRRRIGGWAVVTVIEGAKGRAMTRKWPLWC